MTAKQRRGTRREHQVRDVLREDDWVVYRGAASLGCADLVALKVHRLPRLVQVKSCASGPYDHFRPAERAALKQEAEWAGAEALLAWWPPRGKLRWIAVEEWPA